MSRGDAIFLCELSGNMARPWAEAGYRCWCVDIEHSIRRDRVEDNIHYVWGDVRSWVPPAGVRPVFCAAFTPCTHVSGAGARDFSKKRSYMLRDALEMFEAGRQVCAWSGAPLGSMMWKLPPTDDRADLRSATPSGFARATFLANAPHLKARAAA